MATTNFVDGTTLIVADWLNDVDAAVYEGLFPAGVIAGDPGTEGSGITVGGTLYDSVLKASNLGGGNEAQFIMHRHSTTLGPVLMAARSNTNDDTHAAVADGQVLFSVIGAGYDGTEYEIGAEINMVVDGTPGANDMPGRIEFYTTRPGSATPSLSATIDALGSFIMNSTTVVSESLFEVGYDSAGQNGAGVYLHSDNAASAGDLLYVESFSAGGAINVYHGSTGSGLLLYGDGNRTQALATIQVDNASATGSALEILHNGLGFALEVTNTLGDALSVTGASSLEDVALSGALETSASTTGRSGLNIPEGVAPSAPVDGDVWVTAAGAFNARLNGATVNLAAGGGGGIGGSIADDQIAIGAAVANDIEGSAEFTFDGSNLGIGATATNSYGFATLGSMSFAIDSGGTRTDRVFEWGSNNTNPGFGWTAHMRLSDGPASEAELEVFGNLKLAASTTSAASINMAEGVAPSSPVDGDVWVTTAGAFNARLNGVTIDLAAAGGGDVTKVGTPVNSQLGVWTGDGTIEGDANLTYTGSKFFFGNTDAFDKSFLLNVDNATMRLTGGSNTFNGGNITLYGNTHATNANDIVFSAGSDGVGQYDDSANQWVWNAPAVFNGEATLAPINIPHGTTPSVLNDGDMWTTTAGLYVRINGSTVGPLA